VCTKAVAVVRAVGADFFLDRWHVEIVDMKSTSSFLDTDTCRLSFMWEVPTTLFTVLRHTASEVIFVTNKQTHSVVRVRERTIPTERQPLVGDVTANFCG
jgi:hypothetical protein